MKQSTCVFIQGLAERMYKEVKFIFVADIYAASITCPHGV